MAWPTPLAWVLLIGYLAIGVCLGAALALLIGELRGLIREILEWHEGRRK